MADIETLIIAALKQRENDAAQAAEEQRLRQRESVERFHDDLERVFGDLASVLDMTVEQPTAYYNDCRTARFVFRNRPYSLTSHNGEGWSITRLDQRGEDDERRLPSESFTAFWRTEYRDHNRQNLLIALVELDATPEAAPITLRTEIKPEEPRQMTWGEQHLLDALAKFIDDRTQPY